MKGLFDALGDPPWVHVVTCPCGATLKTDKDHLVEKFLENHKQHSKNEPPPKTPTA